MKSKLDNRSNQAYWHNTQTVERNAKICFLPQVCVSGICGLSSLSLSLIYKINTWEIKK